MPAKTIPFTIASLAALPRPTSGDETYNNPAKRWNVVRVYPNETTFGVYRKVGGVPVRIVLGVFDPNIPASRDLPPGTDPLEYIGQRPALNPRMQAKLADAVIAEMNKGENPAAIARTARRKREGELTLGAAFTHYDTDYLQPEAIRTAKDLRYLFQRYLGAMPPDAKRKHGRLRTKSPHGVNWESRKLSTITADDVSKLMKALRAGHGAPTANRAFELLRAIYNQMIKSKLYDGPNPCAGLPKYKESKRKRFLKGEELPAFFTALAAVPEGAFKDYVHLSIYTGARRNNVLAMEWAHLDLHAGLWNVPAAQSKNEDDMTVPLTERAIEILERRREADPTGRFVFPADSASGHATPFKKPWRALLDAAGIPDIRIHDLRRTAGSWAAFAGASLPIIGASLGHKSAQSTQVYAHLQSSPVRDAMQRAQDAMASAAAKTTATVHQLPRRKAANESN